MHQIFRNILKYHIAIFISLFAVTCAAQNTLDGRAVTIPEAEADRQSAFVAAESERLLGHYDKAIELFKKFTYDNPDNAAAWYNMSRAYFAQNDLGNALDAVAKAVALDSENEWYRIFQADIYEKNGRVADAIGIYESLSKQFPQTLEFLDHLAYLQVLSGDPQAGLRTIDKIEKTYGIKEETSMEKHLIYVGMGEDKKAASELEKLANAYPARLEFRHRLAQFYETIGDGDNARKVYEDILKIDPNDKVARLAAVQKGKNSSDADYIASLKPLFADPKISIDAKVKEVLPYFPKLDAGADAALTENLLELAQAMEIAHSSDPKAWSLSGDLFYHANRLSEALERYQKCIALNPTVFSVWDNTLDILHAQKRWDDMLRIAEQAMDAFPNQPGGYYYYGLAAIEKGKYDDAIAQLEQALLMTGNNPVMKIDVTDLIGRALSGKKNYAAATARYEALLDKGGDKSPDFLEHYGDALFKKGEQGKAVEFWQKAYAIRKSPALEQKISSGKL
ncbi:MAG: tetratricopeptide repeat protein [Lewinellaceae bacterium]|nr:tetratricopeptide repeat protein [Saprospiraceae bacterium]MCB9356536.1 tetratricopeptide repeat protein [Lewinellaceae bacterium]